MRKYIVEKVELINNKAVYTETKHTSSENLRDDFNDLHYSPFLDSQLTLVEYLEQNGSFYKCTLSTNTMGGRGGLSELTDINIPE